MSFSVSWLWGDHRSARPLSRPIMNSPVFCTSRAWQMVKGNARHHANAASVITGTKTAKRLHELTRKPAHIILRLTRVGLVNKDQRDVRQDEEQEPPQSEKMEGARPLPVQGAADPTQVVRIAGLFISPVTIEVGAAMKTV